jgi:hypothetical protein
MTTTISEASLTTVCQRLKCSAAVVERLVAQRLLPCRDGVITSAAIDGSLRSNSFLLMVSRLKREELKAAAAAEAKTLEDIERRTNLLRLLEQAKEVGDHEAAIAICDKLLELQNGDTINV